MVINENTNNNFDGLKTIVAQHCWRPPWLQFNNIGWSSDFISFPKDYWFTLVLLFFVLFHRNDADDASSSIYETDEEESDNVIAFSF